MWMDVGGFESAYVNTRDAECCAAALVSYVAATAAVSDAIAAAAVAASIAVADTADTADAADAAVAARYAARLATDLVATSVVSLRP